jgi:hypothetical protein
MVFLPIYEAQVLGQFKSLVYAQKRGREKDRPAKHNFESLRVAWRLRKKRAGTQASR